MKTELPFWNHNAAYYPWIARNLGKCRRILDVGCGDGTLARYLAAPERIVTGIDSDEGCIRRAKEKTGNDVECRFFQTDFAVFEAKAGSFDAVLFVASLHHMDAAGAMQKAVSLLADGGLLLIVGLAEPSTFMDRLIDVARAIPSLVVSRLHRMKSSEELGIPTSYRLPPMSEVRALAADCLPGAVIRPALHWRYLLRWEKREG